jgi:hypothetical protein
MTLSRARPGAALGPYLFPVCLALYVPACLYADAHASLRLQYGLGVATVAFLLVMIRLAPSTERRQVLTMVGVATVLEVCCSLIWGVYRYRLHNVPLYVPPGHGLIYLFALRWAKTPLMARYGRMVCRLSLMAATAWTLYDLTVIPHFGGHPDLLGLCLLPVFAVFLRRPNAGVYAGAFLATSALELVGTGFGNWTWQAAMPIIHLPVGNPPSVIAGAYCMLDFVATSLGSRSARARVLDMAAVRRRWWPARMTAGQ